MAPDPKRIARAVAGSFADVALLHSGVSGVSYVAAGADAVSHELDPHETTVEDAFGGVPRWIGVIPYEARRTLERPGWRTTDRRPAPPIASPVWQRFPAVVRIDAKRGEVIVVGDDAGAVARLSAAASAVPAPAQSIDCELDTVPDGAEHLSRVARARALILDGELYQVCLARRFGFVLRGLTEEGRAAAMLDLYERATFRAPCRFGAVLSLPGIDVVSLSPELLLRATSRGGRLARLRTEPIKGTRPRGADASTDEELARELDADPKERAELAMIIDVERNDLGSVCEVGSVQVATEPHVVSHGTVHHREATLVGDVRADVDREAVLTAMVPSGSVTGAPKIRAMEIIAELEADRRGLYTGGLGYVARNGSITLSMAIRTMVIRGDRGWYHSGGGIVADSDPERELSETEWKAQRLFRALRV